jgi:hypothetical protein
MRFPLVRFGRNDSRIAPWEWFFAPVIMPLVLVGTAVLTGVTLLALPFLVSIDWWRRLRFASRMRRQGRFIQWSALEPRLQVGEGTLIVEQAQKAGIRVWWVHDDVLRTAPIQPPLENHLNYFPLTEPHPFFSWCFERYLNPDSGQAILTDPPYSYPPGFATAAFFKDRFPALSVVMTVKLA